MLDNAITESLLLIVVYATVWYALARWKKNNSLADIAWGMGISLLALWSWWQYSAGDDAQNLVTFLTVLWGGRLSYHLFRRNWNAEEDRRYAAWRKAWGKWANIRSYLQIFLLQGVLMLVIVSPVFWINLQENVDYSGLKIIGTILWIFGFAFEIVADRQLKAFVKTKKEGEIMTKGLWKLSRHPNYFGEAVQWWALFIIALSVPYGWVTIISPIIISILLRFVSGVPLIEKKYEKNPAFQRYKKSTNAIIPWIASSDHSS